MSRPWQPFPDMLRRNREFRGKFRPAIVADIHALASGRYDRWCAVKRGDSRTTLFVADPLACRRQAPRPRRRGPPAVVASHSALSTGVPSGPYRPCPIREAGSRDTRYPSANCQRVHDRVRWHQDRLYGRSADDRLGYLPRLLTDRALDDVGPDHAQPPYPWAAFCTVAVDVRAGPRV